MNTSSSGGLGALLALAPENPFFVREARTLGRRQFGALGRTLVLMTLALAVPLLIMERLDNWALPVIVRQAFALFVLGVAHAIACGAAGWQMGTRLFIAEHRQRTLEGIRLISLSPWLWLPQKLLFSVYGLALVWAAAIPAYAALVMRGHFEPHQLAFGAQLAACAGAVAMCAAISMPPEGPPRRGATVAETLPGFGRGTGRLLFAAQMGLMIWNAEWMWVLGGTLRPLTGMRANYTVLYGFRVPHAWEIAGLTFIFILTALGNAFATADPADWRARWLGTAGRALLITVAYYAVVGSMWTFLPYRAAVLAGLPAAVLVLRFGKWGKGRRKEDGRSAREIAVLTSWWDNPVWVRDLRVALRSASLLRLVSAFSFLIAVTVVGMAAYSVFQFTYSRSLSPDYVITESLSRSGMVAAGLAPILWLGSLAALGTRARLRWMDEQRFDTTSQLLSTPLSAEAIVRGRWAASLLVGCTLLLPAVILTLIAVLVGLVNWPQGLPAYLGTLAYLGGMGVALGANVACEGKTSWWVQLLTAFGVMGEVIVLPLILLFGQFLFRQQIEVTAFTWGLIIVLANCGFAYAFYTRSLGIIRAHRRKDFGP